MAGTLTSPLAPPLPGHALTAASTTAPWCGTGAQDHHQARCPSIGVLASTSKYVILLTGLELVGAVGSLKMSTPLQTRVGIATGLVVVGDLIGSGAAQEQAIVGETPNLAARLQGVAEPNAVVIAESTRKLLGSLFELQDLGARELKGMASPVKAWAVLRTSSVESRFEALRASGLTELVGREEELELLLRRWSKTKTGEGQVVLLSGEAGIGKSRLTASLMERLVSEPHTRLRYFCSPQHTDSALYPIIGQMERAAGPFRPAGPASSPRAPEAIRFAIEELPATGMRVWLEVGQERYSNAAVQQLYESAGYPLPRRSP